MTPACSQCGAAYASPEESCARRFEALIALDHSRQDPWGSRHGSAFAVYTLQHAKGQSRQSLERCWALLYRVWILGEPESLVTQSFRSPTARIESSRIPPFPEVTLRRFRVTIADLGGFSPEDYAQRLEAWCRATLEAFGEPAHNA
ncbi:MAG TPA: DUF5946 family protein [Gemmatimonadaceae bacterium]